MVDQTGQIYTIEGVSAAIIMLVTVYIILNTTTLYTPADTHVTDMQIQQLGTDALAMMDTANQINSTGVGVYQQKESDLETYLMTQNRSGFNTTFGKYLNTQYPLDSRQFQWNATVYYYNSTKGINSYPFAQSNQSTGREHYVSVTRWVHLVHPPPPIPTPMIDDRDQVVLLEVLLWRD